MQGSFAPVGGSGMAGKVRRYLTVLFTDLSDSTELSQWLEAEHYAVVTDELRLLFAEVVGIHGGIVNQFQGDGLQAIFGYPLAGENDGADAVEAALEIHARVRQLGARHTAWGLTELAVHSGVHAGNLLTHEGPTLSARVELYGPSPGLAKHLSDLAEAHEILVSEEALGPSAAYFNLRGRRALPVKGRKAPLVAHLAVGRSEVRTRFEAHRQRGLLPFVGRQDELLSVGLALAQARHGHPGFIALSAPAGVGKTRLAEECLQRAQADGWSVLRGYCDEGHRAEPLQPFLQMLRALLAEDTAGSVLPGAQGGPADTATKGASGPAGLAQSSQLLQQLLHRPAAAPRIDMQALIELWRELLTVRTRGQPQLLFVDDWQWADEGARQLSQALRRLEGLPLLLLVTTRPLDPADAALVGAEVVELRPFTAAESRWSVERLLPGLDPFTTDAVIGQAGGNALYLEELCHSLNRPGEMAHVGTALRGGPSWLEALIGSRVARQPPRQAALLGACAVIGSVVPRWQLEALAAGPDDESVLQALAQQDLVFPTEDGKALRFKHGITRDVVYATLGLAERLHMHAQLARRIRERVGTEGELDACESLAHHHAGAGEHEAAARYARMAGDKAQAASALSLARAQYLAALAQLDRLPDAAASYPAWRTVVRRLGFVCVFDPLRSDLPVFDRAVAHAQRAGDGPGLAYAEYWRAYLHYALGDLQVSVRHFDQARQVVERIDDPHLSAQLRATHGQALSAAADYPAALALLDATHTTGPMTAQAGNPSGRAFSLACKASVLGDLGRFDEALACSDLALQALPHAGHEVEGSVRCWRSAILLWQGRWAQAGDEADAARQIGERVQSLYLLAMAQALAAFARWRQDARPQALADLQEAASWLEGRDKQLFISLVRGWRAQALLDSGDAVAARRPALRALARRHQRDWLGVAMAARVLATLALRQGRKGRAQALLRRADEAAGRRQSAHEEACNALAWAALHVEQGEAEAARTRAAAARQAFDRLGMAWHRAQCPP
jgi:class 3 adenylate cyclase/tetratricopeptide (TPR) repeat protein